MKEIHLHTEDRENSNAMVKEVGGREARESHLSWAEVNKKQWWSHMARGGVQDNTSDTPRTLQTFSKRDFTPHLPTQCFSKCTAEKTLCTTTFFISYTFQNGLHKSFSLLCCIKMPMPEIFQGWVLFDFVHIQTLRWPCLHQTPVDVQLPTVSCSCISKCWEAQNACSSTNLYTRRWCHPLLTRRNSGQQTNINSPNSKGYYQSSQINAVWKPMRRIPHADTGLVLTYFVNYNRWGLL